MKNNQNSLKRKNLIIEQSVVQNYYINTLCKNKNGSRAIYETLIGRRDSIPSPPKSEHYWKCHRNQLTGNTIMIKNIKEVKLQEV